MTDSLWWYCLAFFALGALGGAIIARCALEEAFDIKLDKAIEDMREEEARARHRKLLDSGRNHPARIDAGAPAVRRNLKVRRPRIKR